jgi:hypothetical protein
MIKKSRQAVKRPKKTVTLQRSKLEVVDIAIEDLIPDGDNPNQQDESTFDLLVDEIREHGFDEPIQVRPHPTEAGKYQISSGHHRAKAATVIGMESIPAIIKEYSDRDQKISLVKRNTLRGDMDKTKLAKLYHDVAKGRDAVQVQRELGFTNPKKFEAMIDEVSKTLTPKQKAKLANAKEDIKSMDDLSSVLNRIFKESGSEVEKGYMVFSFGGKKHHYYQIDDKTSKKLELINKMCEDHDLSLVEVMQSIVADAELPTTEKSAIKKRPTKKSK